MASARLDGRNGEVWKRYAIYGWTLEKIADHFDLSHQRVSQIVREVGEGIPDVNRAELIQQSLEFMKHVQKEALAVADMAGAPVAVGKDGEPLYDPETGEVVRDYSGRLRALETAARIDEQIAKRFGLNAPDRLETTAKVTYEIVDVDSAELT